MSQMPEECSMPSKSCVYVLVSTSNTAALYDFDGVYILDGGFAENTSGFVAHVSNVSAVLISSPTLRNLGTTAALLEQDKPLPVFLNVKPLKNVKPGSSGEVVKNIQEANSKWLPVTQPLFNLKYSPHIIYHSAAKGILSLYILAGDTKDAEVLTKTLVGGNDAEVERAAADHGTIGVLLWRPAQADKAVVRVLISGTSSLVRIQQSLDKAAKSLPFLNAPIVKSKNALSDIPPPVVPRPLVSVAGKLPARSATRGPSRTATFTAEAPRPFTCRPQANGNPAIPKTAMSRPFTSRPHANGNPVIPKTAASRPFTSRPHVNENPAISKAAVSRPFTSRPHLNGNPAISKAAASRPFTSRPHANGNPAIQKTAAPTARRNAPSRTVPAISKPPTMVPAKSSTKKNPTRTPDKQQGTGRSTEPVSLKKTLGKVQGATPPKTTPVMIDTTPTNIALVPEPIAEKEPSIVETPLGVETPFDFSKEISKQIEIKIDTNSTMQISYDLDNTVGESFPLSAEMQRLCLDEKTDEYVGKLCSQITEDATLHLTSALANNIASVNGSQGPEQSGHSTSTQVQNVGLIKNILKHDIMQSRLNVIENGAQISYEEAGTALGDVLNACPSESEKLDAAASSPTQTLHMPAGAGTGVAAKPVKFSRPYYFDVVSVPRNEILETSVPAESLQEFIAKVRSRNVILASKQISSEQFQAILSGKQSWSDSVHSCNVIPTHSSPTLLDFLQKNEEHFPAAHLSVAIPVERQRTRVSSEAGLVEYELARIALE